MALVVCPECGKEISDKAKSCPNCGYVMNEKIGYVKNPYKGKKITIVGFLIALCGAIFFNNNLETMFTFLTVGILTTIVGKAITWFHN
jgi:ribosomal protein L37E